jgi:N-acetylglucosaminyldiphosphoundecaprenol N-acetyl-beta-D-mannosaminyltransferase
VGPYTPPFRELTETEELDLARRLDECKPDIVWVGISTPKQELFMSQYCGRFNVRVMVGVGAAFDFHTGRLKDSPYWVKRSGMQWLHRLLQEPGRLWWRYVRTNTIFVYLALLSLARGFAPASSPRNSVPDRPASE